MLFLHQTLWRDRVDPELAGRARAVDSTFLARYAEGSGPRRTYLRTNRDSLLAAYGRFEEALGRLVDETTAPSADSMAAAIRPRVLIGRQAVRSIMAYIRQQTAPDDRVYAEERNRGMAENVRFLAEELFPDRRIIVWAHNTHVRQYRLARAGYRLSLFDLERQGWAKREQTLRFNGRHDQRMVPAEQYDALILIVDVRPPQFLY